MSADRDYPSMNKQSDEEPLLSKILGTVRGIVSNQQDVLAGIEMKLESIMREEVEVCMNKSDPRGSVLTKSGSPDFADAINSELSHLDNITQRIRRVSNRIDKIV